MGDFLSPLLAFQKFNQIRGALTFSMYFNMQSRNMKTLKIVLLGLSALTNDQDARV
jgi:hypothetical protein